MFAVLTACGDGGSVASSGTTTGSAPVASIQLSATPTSVKSDNTNTSTISVTALDAANAAVANATVAMSADTGILSAGSINTGSTGTVTLTFSSGSASKMNRTATITATGGGATAQIPVQITGSTVTVSASTTTLPDDGSGPATLTITAKDAGGNVVSNAAVTLAVTGTGIVTLTPSTGTTDVNGKLTVVAAGVAGGAGTATVTVSAVGATATSTLIVQPAGSSFSIDQQTLNGTVIVGNPAVSAINIGDSLIVQVNAPLPTTDVVFATSAGIWNTSSAVVTVPVNTTTRKASATLTTAVAGVASVQAYDSTLPSTSDTLTVYMTAAVASASKITISAAPSVVPKSSGSYVGYSTLTASVKDAAGNPVGGAPVAFQIINPTGGGETISPVVSVTATTTTGGLNLGDAPTTFTSGSLTTGATGVQIRASVVGTAVATEALGVDVTTSGNDASVVIGGLAGSVVFGRATVLGVNSNASQYVQPMSVLVADANGNPAPAGTVVNLSVWPIAWSTSSLACDWDPDGMTWNPTGGASGTGAYDVTNPKGGTFKNEDINENLYLDATPSNEDGTRNYYYSAGANPAVSTKDVKLTPSSSASGAVPATVYTDASGVANFDLTYPKTSGLWIVDRIRGKTTVSGSEAVGEMVFRLGVLKSDAQPCILPPSPYKY